MNTLVLITENIAEKNQWQFARVMALLAYDFDITVVFMHPDYQQLSNFKAWRSLEIYGVKKIFALHNGIQVIAQVIEDKNINIKKITQQQLKLLITEVEFII